MNINYSYKELSKRQNSHIDVLQNKVFELNKYPSFKLLIEGLVQILIKYDHEERNVCILERTKLYGTSLFGGLFQNAIINSYDCSPSSAEERGSYNSFMVDNDDFIKFTDVNSLIQDESFKLPENTFDVIFIPNLIHHFRNQKLLFSECFQSLKDNGELVVFEPTFREIHQAPHDYLRYTPYGIKEIYQDNLFAQINCEEIGDSFEALEYILNIMEAKRKDENFLNWCKNMRENINNFKQDKKDIVKKHARFPTAFLCKGFKNVKK